MHSPIQFTRRAATRPGAASGMRAVLLLWLIVACVALPRAQAQQVPPTPIGRVEGNDVTVQGGTAPGSDNETITPRVLVANGSVVTVHSGKARMTLFSGGEVDICGPAKFTLLQSGAAITVALDFGQLHVELPAATPLRIFTPSIVATPIDINGAARDVTVGLNRDDSLCVLATSGAIQLEHQFSGEKLIVPQNGEFFLNAGQLLPVVGKPGSCQCAAMRTRPMLPPSTRPPEYALESRMPAAEPPQPLPEPPAPASPAAEEPSISPNVEFSIPEHANESHPVVPSAKNPAPEAPPASAPVYTVVAPPLTFNASSPAPPPEPPLDTFMLVREAHVQPEWEFHGHVDAPDFASAMQRALGEGPTAGDQPPAEPRKEHGGFWGFLRRIFGGS
jgi:hypothetical protein